MKAAILDISVVFLLDSLGLPTDTKITNCRMAFDRPGVIEFLIESDDLAEVNEGCFIPRVNPVYEEGEFVKFK